MERLTIAPGEPLSRLAVTAAVFIGSAITIQTVNDDQAVFPGSHTRADQPVSCNRRLFLNFQHDANLRSPQDEIAEWMDGIADQLPY